MKVRFILALILLLMVAACEDDDGSGGGASSRSLEVTIPPLAARSIVDGCPSGVLEDWFEKTYFNMQSFVDEAEVNARAASDERRSEIDFVLDGLIALHNSINNVPTPACVEATHRAIVDDMQKVIDHYQRFANATITAEELYQQVSEDLVPIKEAIATLEETTAALW